jgi:hypothetical protein
MAEKVERADSKGKTIFIVATTGPEAPERRSWPRGRAQRRAGEHLLKARCGSKMARRKICALKRASIR